MSLVLAGISGTHILSIPLCRHTWSASLFRSKLGGPHLQFFRHTLGGSYLYQYSTMSFVRLVSSSWRSLKVAAFLHLVRTTYLPLAFLNFNLQGGWLGLATGAPAWCTRTSIGIDVRKSMSNCWVLLNLLREEIIKTQLNLVFNIFYYTLGHEICLCLLPNCCYFL